MPEFFADHPGWTYLAAVLLPLAAGGVALLAGLAGDASRSAADYNRFARWLCRQLGGVRPPRSMAILTAGGLLIAAGLALVGLFDFLTRGPRETLGGRVEWLRLGPPPGSGRAVVFSLGYSVDRLTALLSAAVAVVALLVAVASLGLPAGAADDAPPGRRGRSLAYLSLFVAALLGLLLADNLLQLFLSWQLVGACSCLLIGLGRDQRAALKAVVIYRVGDAGFLIALLIAWSAFGTLDLYAVAPRAKSVVVAWRFMDLFLDGNAPEAAREKLASQLRAAGMSVEDVYAEDRRLMLARIRENGGVTYPALIVMGVGLFLGCVALSAMVPLHGWLPDAVAGPAPGFALVPAATLGVAGVYLVARCYGLFAPEAALVVAYTGAVTVFVAATAACVQTDIPRVVAYAACSQVGMMMLALGVNGWAAGVFHLLTQLFCTALVLLGAVAVVHGLRGERDLQFVGGLRRRMPVTAVGMLAGVLAVGGCPPFGGWYSRGAVLSAAAARALAGPAHAALFVLPLLTAGLTAFALARLWFLVFVGEPRDPATHDYVRESPARVTGPLLVLAFVSLVVGWGWPIWDAGASALRYQVTAGVHPQYGHVQMFGYEGNPLFQAGLQVAAYHHFLEMAAGLVAAVGVALAAWLYLFREPLFAPDPPGRVRAFFLNGWGVDAVWDNAVVGPVLWLARRLAGRPRD